MFWICNKLNNKCVVNLIIKSSYKLLVKFDGKKDYVYFLARQTRHALKGLIFLNIIIEF